MTSETKHDDDFEWLANVYNMNGAINHPSELHGIMIGELAGDLKREGENFLELTLDHMGVEELNLERQANLAAELKVLYESVVEGIDADSSSFNMLLPDDSYALSERIDALAVWVGGFLEGLAMAQSAALSQVDPDLLEILQDLVEISQLDSRAESSETGEKEFFEVCEYVRIGVLNLYAEFNEVYDDVPELNESELTQNQAAENKPTLH
jgi:uncharacterized protein YgfB (UPF0149 family)